MVSAKVSSGERSEVRNCAVLPSPPSPLQNVPAIGVKSVSGGVCILQVLTCLRHILISPILRTRIRPRMGAQIAFDGRCDQQVESYQQSQRAEGWDGIVPYQVNGQWPTAAKC